MQILVFINKINLIFYEKLRRFSKVFSVLSFKMTLQFNGLLPLRSPNFTRSKYRILSSSLASTSVNPKVKRLCIVFLHLGCLQNFFLHVVVSLQMYVQGQVISTVETRRADKATRTAGDSIVKYQERTPSVCDFGVQK
jgi:hypothetical protein